VKRVDPQYVGTLIEVGEEVSQILKTLFYVVIEVEWRMGGRGECESRQ
jgi:hypothetical protein